MPLFPNSQPYFNMIQISVSSTTLTEVYTSICLFSFLEPDCYKVPSFPLHPSFLKHISYFILLLFSPTTESSVQLSLIDQFLFSH